MDKIITIFLGIISFYPSIGYSYLYETNISIDPHETQMKDFTKLLPGEQIDYHTGEVGHFLETVNIKGNGLPIKLGHRYHSEQGYDIDIGRMSIEVPRIEFIHMGEPDYLGWITDGGGGGSETYTVATPYKTNIHCSNLTLPSDAEYQWPYYESIPTPIPQDPNSILRSGIKIKLGYKSIDFFPKAHDPSNRFPSSAVYISPSNWYIECVSSPNITGNNAFKAVSPDGVEYIFDVYQEAGIHAGLLSDYPVFNQDTKVYVRTVTDKHGNSLSYEYDQFDAVELLEPDGEKTELQYYRSRIKTISASDGRRVDITYPADSIIIQSNSSNPIKLIYAASNRGDRLKIIRKDGSFWEYNYINAYNSYQDIAKIIKNIKYPNDLRVIYEYIVRDRRKYLEGSGVFFKSALDKRTVSGPNLTTLIENFTYNGNSTFVESPVSSIEYRYGKIDFLEHPLNTPVSAGKLNRLSFFPKGTTFSQRNSITPLKRIDYSYSRVGNVIDLDYLKNNWLVPQGFSQLPTEIMTSTHSSFLMAATTISTQINGYTFTTQKSNYDDWGNAGTITESNTLGESKVTTKTYNYDIPNWIVGQLASKSVTGESANISIHYNSNGTVNNKSIYGITEYYTYHSDGNLNQLKMYKGGSLLPKMTYWDYYRGIARNEKDGENNNQRIEVYDFGEIKSKTDFNGHLATSFEYDSLHRLAKIIPPIEALEVISWPTATKKISTKAGYRQTIDYNAMMEPVLVTEQDTSRNEVRYFRQKYDAAGLLSYEALPSLNNNDAIGKEYTYDSLGRVKTVKHTADNSITRYCYGSSCGAGTKHGLAVTDQRGYKHVWNYLAYGDPDIREIEEIKQHKSLSPNTNYITTTINRGRYFQIKSIVQAGVTRNFTHKAGTLQLNTKTEPEIGTTQYISYDERGNLLQKKVGNSGVTIFTYDNDDKIIFIDYPGSTNDVDYEYQGKNLSLLTTGNNQTVWNYSDRDELNKIKTESLSIDGLTFNISYHYDNLGNLDYMRLPRIENPSSSKIIDVTVDALGRTRSIDGFVSNIDYYANDVISNMFYANGYTYSANLNTKRLPENISTTNITRNLIDLTYVYDRSGNVESITDYILSNNDRTMEYDGLDRLTVANGRWGLGALSYTDTNDIKSMSLGNKALTYTYDVTQRLKQVAGSLNKNYQYDVYGNVTANSSDTFYYDDASQMLSVINQNIDYTYDGNKKRVKVHTPSKDVYYIYNHSGELLYRYDATLNKDVEYVNLNGKLLAKMENGPSVTASVIIDTDGDGLSDPDELAWGTNLNNADTDGDEISDGDEVVQGRNPLVFDLALTPTGLSAPSFSSNGNYSVSWNRSSISSSYQLLEKKDGGSWVERYNGTATSSSFSGKISGTYYYKIRACNGGRCSNYSNQISASVVYRPAIPTGLTVPPSNNGYVVVRWHSSPTATTYELKTRIRGSWSVIYSGSSLEKYVNFSTSYHNYFRIRACNLAGCSAYSSQVRTYYHIGGA